MHTVQLGDRVRVHYARLRDPAAGGKPTSRRAVEFTAGTKHMIPTLSLGVVGMVQGQHKRLTLQPGEAFGGVQPKLVKEIPRYRFPKRLKLEVGRRLTAVHRTSGQRRRVTIVEVTPHSVVVDGNHPLAGKAVVVEIVVISVDSSSSANQQAPVRRGRRELASYL